MKKVITIISLLLTLANMVFAQWQPTSGPYGGDIRSMVIDPISSNVFVGTNKGGVFLSTNNANSWTRLNTGIYSSIAVYSLAISGNTIYAGTYGSGIYKSTDNGNSWITVNTGLDNGIFVRSLAVNGDKVYAGTNNGIFFSDDNGNSWVPINNGLTNLFINSILIKGDNIYAGSSGGGIFKSTNNGSSWVSMNNGLSENSLTINVLAIIDNNIYAGTGGGLFMSDNDGQSWSNIYLNLNTSVNSIAKKGNSLFIGTYFKGVFRSIDNGVNWSPINNGIKTNDVISSIIINGNSLLAATWGKGIFSSSDNGDSWIQKNYDLNGSFISSMAFNNNLYSGGWGGVFLSSNLGQSWTDLNDGLISHSINAIASSGSNIYAGTQEKGFFISTNNGGNWVEANNGLTNTDVRVIGLKGDKIFAGTGNGVYLSSNNGQSWSAANDGLLDTYITSIAISNDNIFVGTAKGVFLSSNDGTTWAEKNNGLTCKTVWSVACKGNNIIAGTSLGIFISSDNGNTWLLKSNGVFNVMALAVDGDNIYAATLEFGLFISTNNGNDWFQSNNNLSNISLRSLLINNGFIYAGTIGSGVWKRNVKELSLNKNAIEVESNESNSDVDIISTINWTASSSETWATPYSATSGGDGVLTINVKANPLTLPRNATITVMGNGVAPQYINITQKAKASSINLDGETPIISMFPNPTTGKFSLDLGWDSQDDVNVKITNALGIIIYEKLVKKTYSNFKHELVLTNQVNGIYFVTIQTNKFRIVKSIVLTH